MLEIDVLVACLVKVVLILLTEVSRRDRRGSVREGSSSSRRRVDAGVIAGIILAIHTDQSTSKILESADGGISNSRFSNILSFLSSLFGIGDCW